MRLTNVLGINFSVATLDQATDLVMEFSLQRKKGLVVTPNVDHLVSFENDLHMADIFANALIRFCDGMPIVWYSKTLGLNNSLPERVAGSDLFFTVCQAAAKNNQSIYLMGGREGSCELAINIILSMYPNLKFVGYSCPILGFEHDEFVCHELVRSINKVSPDIIILGLGTPKQEKWASQWMSHLNCGPILCLGAAIDLAAGKVRRAPKIMQKSGFEWLWRLIMEPRRLWKRYILKDSYFIIIVFKDILKRIFHKIKS